MPEVTKELMKRFWKIRKVMSSGAEVKKAVAANPDAIGYIDSSEVDASVKVLFSAD
jgi:ABC-type phosphate transport system substrate-binding protein